MPAATAARVAAAARMPPACRARDGDDEGGEEPVADHHHHEDVVLAGQVPGEPSCTREDEASSRPSAGCRAGCSAALRRPSQARRRHVALAPEAGPPLHREARRRRAPGARRRRRCRSRPCRRVRVWRATSASSAGSQSSGLRAGREAVEEPGVGAARPSAAGSARASPKTTVRRRPSSVTNGAARRPGATRARRASGRRGRGRPRARRHVARPAAGRPRSSVTRQRARRSRSSRQAAPRGEEVEPGAEAQLGDGEAGPEPLGQAVAGEKDVARLGQPVLQRVVRVGEPARDRHAVPPIELGALVRHRISVLAWLRREIWRRAGRMAMVDLTVRGAGIFGLAVAWAACAAAPACAWWTRPARAPARPAASSARWRRTCRTRGREEGVPARQPAAGRELLGRRSSVSGLSSGYGRLGASMPLADDAAVARARTRPRPRRRDWGGAATWTVVAADDWAPAPTGFSCTIRCPRASTRARAAASLAAALRRRGVEIVPEAADEGAVVWATGSPGLLSRQLGRSGKAASRGRGRARLRGRATGRQRRSSSRRAPYRAACDGTVGVGSTSERDWTDPRDRRAARRAVRGARSQAAAPLCRTRR